MSNDHGFSYFSIHPEDGPPPDEIPARLGRPLVVTSGPAAVVSLDVVNIYTIGIHIQFAIRLLEGRKEDTEAFRSFVKNPYYSNGDLSVFPRLVESDSKTKSGPFTGSAAAYEPTGEQPIWNHMRGSSHPRLWTFEYFTFPLRLDYDLALEACWPARGVNRGHIRLRRRDIKSALDDVRHLFAG